MVSQSSTVAVSLLQAGGLLGVVLLARIVAARHIPLETVPAALRRRVELSNRLVPWLSAATILVAGTGLVLHLGPWS